MTFADREVTVVACCCCGIFAEVEAWLLAAKMCVRWRERSCKEETIALSKINIEILRPQIMRSHRHHTKYALMTCLELFAVVKCGKHSSSGRRFMGTREPSGPHPANISDTTI